MRKLTLALDELQVESFETAARPQSRGTVWAHQTVVGSCGQGTCYDSCGDDCGSWFCVTNFDTCGEFGCVETSVWTGCGNCVESQNEAWTCIATCEHTTCVGSCGC